jgi:hypothetical protein
MISDEELLEVVQDFREGILDGNGSTAMCYAVCWPLASYLRVGCGIDCELIESDLQNSDVLAANHYWLRMPDGRVLDPTYDQFCEDGPAVYLGEPLEIHSAR